jgi:penicillin amidase
VWRRIGRIAVVTVAALAALALVATVTVIWQVRRSFPGYSGKQRLSGLSAPVTVYRDAHGIPQVYAANAEDLFRAQGYLHAQERFWEMDFRRHITSGRLSELFGADQVDTDRYIRTLGWRRTAQQEWDSVSSPDTRRYLSAYAEGVNGWLAGHGNTSTVSLEYSILGLQSTGYRIEKWDPVDSVAWLKAMAWDLRGNMTEEFDRASLLAHGLSRDQIEQLYPRYPYQKNLPIIRTTGVVEGPTGSGIGSNSWVLAGSHTTTGKPILANDPHLAPSMPGVWYQMGLHCGCGLNVEGFTFSGVPGVVIGHNDRIAWGFTNLGPDVTDLYLERLDGNRYQVDGQWRDLDVRQETIKVAGGRPVTITVRTGKDGPLLSDASADLRSIGQNQYAVALRWTASDPGHSIDALFALDGARNWADFRAAAALFEVPAQNMVYADVDGNIGYQAPGKIPIRGKGDGRWPAPGWDSGYGWTGYVPFAELPTVYNPAQGYIVTANQAVTGPEYPRFLTDDWSYGYRSQRINDMIAAGGKLSVSDVARMQFDSRNGMAPLLVPLLLQVPASGSAAKARELLRGWDFQQPADGKPGTAQAQSSAAAAFYNAVWKHLLARIFDELPAGLKPDGDDRWFEVVRSLLANPSSRWWDDRSTSTVESATDIAAEAVREAAGELERRLGADPGAWRWGRLHQLTVRNQTFGKSGIAPIEWLFNADPAGTSGGGAIVNATGWDASVGYEVTWVPSMRMIVDLSNLDGSRWVNLTGESGHAFSTHYADQFELWRTGRTLPMRWSRPTIEHESRDKLTLSAR